MSEVLTRVYGAQALPELEKLAQQAIQGAPQQMQTLDALAHARAEEMLKVAGAELPNTEEAGGQEDVLDDAVTLRAMEMLDQSGYDPDKVLEKVALAVKYAEEKKTYPISRALTSPLAMGAAGAGLGGLGGAGGMAVIQKALGRAGIPAGALGGGKAILLSGLLGGGILGGGTLGGTALGRWLHTRGAAGRAAKGQETGIGEAETRILQALKNR